MIKSLVITARRWNDFYGNTYFSASAIADGKQVAGIAYEYGYGDHYLDAIAEMLETDGYLPDREHYHNGGAEPLPRYCREHGIALHYEAIDVQRKKDL